jgi:hypothetical protein
MSVTKSETTSPSIIDDLKGLLSSVRESEGAKRTADAGREPEAQTKPKMEAKVEPVVIETKRVIVEETLTPKTIKHDEVLAKPVVIPPQHQLAPERDREDSRDVLTKAIESNPCQLCSKVRKLGRCVCITSLAGAAAMLGIVEPKTGAMTEEEEDRFIEEETRATSVATPEHAVLQQFQQLRPTQPAQRTLHPAILLIMGELLAKGLLNIKQNPEEGILEFLYEYNPNQEPGDRNKFELMIDSIVAELEIFRLQHSIIHNCHTLCRDTDGLLSGLRINFVNPLHYDRFIMIFETPNSQLQNNRNSFIPRQLELLKNPFSTRLTLATGQSQQDEEEQEQNYFSPLRIPNPRDGFKPYGYK